MVLLNHYGGDMDTGQIWKQTSVVMFLTAVAVWAFWQINDPPSANTVFLRLEQGERVFYHFPFLNLGFSRLWPDLIGWPLLTGTMSAATLWEMTLLNEISLSLAKTNYPDASMQGKDEIKDTSLLNWAFFFILLFGGVGCGLAFALFLGILAGAAIVVGTTKDYPGERLFNVTAWVISLTLVAVPVATTVNGLAGVIFLSSLLLSGALITGLLFGAWYSLKFLTSLRPKVEERNPTIDSGQ